MGRKGAVTLSLVCVFFGLLSRPAFGLPAWQKVSKGILESNIQSATVNFSDGLVYFVSTQSLYSIQLPNYSAIQISLLPSGINQVYQLKVSKDNPDVLFVLTDSGAYTFSMTKKSWKKIYEDSKENSQAVYDLLEVGDVVYLATATGLVVGAKTLSIWKKISQLNNQIVYRLRESNKFIYAVTGQDIYCMKRKSKEWGKIFSIGSYSTEEVGIEGNDSLKTFIKDVLVLDQDSDELMIVTAQGVFQSKGGKNFKAVNSVGLPYEKVIMLININFSSHGNCQEGKVCLSSLASSSDGVYVFNGKSWQKLFQGIESNDVRVLVMDQKYVWAATARGLFYLPVGELQEKERGHKVIRLLGDQGEPTIAQVQKWAIDYAEVNPDKIKNWRRAVGQKALLPDLSVGLNRDAGEIFHWDTGPSPDVLQKGRDLTDWDVSLSWDLGELVWNNDQTSIDSRSKLMVELRQDILDQLTRLYYERRRLILTLNNSDEDAEEVTLRVQELTALIDGYTGGLFSKEIEGLPRHQVTIPGK